MGLAGPATRKGLTESSAVSKVVEVLSLPRRTPNYGEHHDKQPASFSKKASVFDTSQSKTAGKGSYDWTIRLNKGQHRRTHTHHCRVAVCPIWLQRGEHARNCFGRRGE